MMKKTKSKSGNKSTLREMPEIDDSTFVFLGRGLYANHARKAFGTVVVERSVLDALGGEEGAANVLRALAMSLKELPTKASRKTKKSAA